MEGGGGRVLGWHGGAVRFGIERGEGEVAGQVG